jgi:hypothetical protein
MTQMAKTILSKCFSENEVLENRNQSSRKTRSNLSSLTQGSLSSLTQAALMDLIVLHQARTIFQQSLVLRQTHCAVLVKLMPTETTD